MFRIYIAIALTVFALSGRTAVASERVALFLTDPEAPDSTCQFKRIADTVSDLRFKIVTAKGAQDDAALTKFSEQSASAEAAMIYACNPQERKALPALLRASKLNFLFLLETTYADDGSPISHLLKTKRDDLMIVHARLKSPENEDIFARTLTHKLRRPYTLAADIISRTVVSSYYRSRGSMLVKVEGRIGSGYILAKPPTDQILDAWSRVQHSKDRKALEAFIAKFPKTLFADLARTRLAKLPQQ